MGGARTIGFALAALLASSDTAVAPPYAASEPPRDSAPCAPVAPSAIALDCAPARDWIGASILAGDPLAAVRFAAPHDASPSPVAERLAATDLAPVPEPAPLFGLALGLAGFAIARAAKATHSG